MILCVKAQLVCTVDHNKCKKMHTVRLYVMGEFVWGKSCGGQKRWKLPSDYLSKILVIFSGILEGALTH